MKLLSLCTGYGGLDLAVEAFFDCELVACAEIDKYASLAIDKHFKVPNLGDIKLIDWASLGDIDIMTAGYPCQPFSHAGQRKGIQDERHIWPYIKEGISLLRPSLVILENVRGHLSLGFKEVLQELTEIGYDATWTVVRASDVGAPHQRARLFIIAYPISDGRSLQTFGQKPSKQKSNGNGATQLITDPNSDAFTQSRRINRSIRGKTSEIQHGTNRDEHWSSNKDVVNTNISSRGKPSSIENDCDSNHQQLPSNGQVPQLGWRFDSRFEMSMRSIPDPLVDGKLNTKFVEYMMGLPEGWVTDLPISRAQQFKMLGNGVVPQQAFYALEKLWAIKEAF